MEVIVAIIIALITAISNIVGMIITGRNSTKVAIINSNSRQEKTEQKLTASIEELQKNNMEIKSRLDELKETDSCCATLQKDVVNLKKENGLTMKAMFACLDGLTQLGCNHSVTDTKNELESWLNEQAHD